MQIPVLILLMGGSVLSAKAGNTAPDLLAFFDNACWNGTFVGKKDTDVHCFRQMVNGRFVRDNHEVRSSRGHYGGETVFWVNEAGKLVYTYWDTRGGVSHGEMIPTKTGFESPAERYRGPNGTDMTIQTRWILEPPNAYTMESVKLNGDKATRMFAIEYRRAPLVRCPGPACSKASR